jgi:hypothetical protein
MIEPAVFFPAERARGYRACGASADRFTSAGGRVGAKNVAGPTLEQPGQRFRPAQPLIGKSLAIASDARFIGRDAGVVVERLLSIYNV